MSAPRLFGWTPASADGDEVQIPPSAAASGQFTFRVAVTAPSAPPPSAVSSTTSSSATVFGLDLTAPTQSLPSTERVGRPRNAFIIFRTEFSRLFHNPQRKDRRRNLKNATRTVSGLAADAWHQLSATERQRYHRLAEQEKERHAREHPGYQYRPRRRDQRDRNAGAPSVRSPRPPRARRASPSPELSLESPPVMSPSTPPLSPLTETVTEYPPSSPELEFEPLEPVVPGQGGIDPAIKANRRRSCSVPVTLGEHDLYLSSLSQNLNVGEAEDRWERPENLPVRWERPGPAPLQTVALKRRSRSFTQADWSSSYFAAPPVEQIFDPSGPQTMLFRSSSLYPTPFRVQSPRTQHHTLTLNPAVLFDAETQSSQQAYQHPQHISPLSAVTSSLANWDGQSTPVASPPTASPVTGLSPTEELVSPMAPQPVRPNPPPWLATPPAQLATMATYEFPTPPARPHQQLHIPLSQPQLHAHAHVHPHAYPHSPLLEHGVCVSPGAPVPFPSGGGEFGWQFVLAPQYCGPLSSHSTSAPGHGAPHAQAAALQEYEVGLQQGVHAQGDSPDEFSSYFSLDNDLEKVEMLYPPTPQ